MVQEHSDVKEISVSGEVLPRSLRTTHRLQCRNLNATLIISKCARLNLDYASGLAHRHYLEQYLFVSSYTGTRYSYDAMRYTFKKIFTETGIRTAKGRLPRIHDVRHSFCTISLNKMLNSGIDVQVAVPILAAYMGHVNLRDTEKYIHLTEHGYEEFVRSERALKALIPEVDEDER